MKKQKVKIEDLKVKSFVTNSNQQVRQNKGIGNDGGYTWVG